MITAENWTDVPVRCACRWTTVTGRSGWVLTEAHPGCRDSHEEDS